MEGQRTVRRLTEVALGEGPADLVVIGGTLVNVCTGELQEGVNLAIAEGRIAYVGEELQGLVSEETRVLKAHGLFLAPGFIDPHCHLDSIYQVAEYARWVVPRGTTTAVTEAAMVANAAGPQGVKWFVEDTEGLPLRVFILSPSMVPPFPEFESSKGFPYEAFEELISEGRCLGLGETYWPRVLDRDPRAMERYAEVLRLGKRLEGHSAGARGRRLQAYVAAGTSSCHEATHWEEALERLRLGMAVMVREGYIRRELQAVAPVREAVRDLRGLMLCTDFADPEMVMEQGCMDELVRRAIAYGFTPVEALQMVTINPATYFGLRDLGALVPNHRADVVLFEDLERIRVKAVIKDGKLVAEDGRLLEEPPRYRYPPEAYRTFALKEVRPSDFLIPYPAQEARVRVMKVASETITRAAEAVLKASGGNIPSDPGQDLLKMAHISKHSPEPRLALGFVKGIGLKEGAVATSLIWDTNNILVVGVTEEEMAFAVQRLLEHQGGLFVVRGKEVLASLSLPICGIISPRPMEELAQGIRDFEGACHGLGCKIPRPFLALQTLVFTGLPFLRLTDRGLVDIRRRSFVDLVL